MESWVRVDKSVSFTVNISLDFQEYNMMIENFGLANSDKMRRISVSTLDPPFTVDVGAVEEMWCNF